MQLSEQQIPLPFLTHTAYVKVKYRFIYNLHLCTFQFCLNHGADCKETRTMINLVTRE